MRHLRLPSDTEEALAALAADGARVHLGALAPLEHVMDALESDQRAGTARCDVVARGLREVLGDDLAHALTDDTQCPAEIAARFFRLRDLAALTSTLTAPRS